MFVLSYVCLRVPGRNVEFLSLLNFKRRGFGSVTQFGLVAELSVHIVDITDIVADVIGRYPRLFPAKSIDLSAPPMSVALFIRYARREKSGFESFQERESGFSRKTAKVEEREGNRRVLNHSFLYVGVLTTSPPPQPVINSRTAFSGILYHREERTAREIAVDRMGIVRGS